MDGSWKTDGWIMEDRWTDGWMDGWMDAQIGREVAY